MDGQKTRKENSKKNDATYFPLRDLYFSFRAKTPDHQTVNRFPVFLSRSSSSLVPKLMSPEVGATGTSSHLWMLLCPLLCALMPAGGSTVSSEDLQSATVTPVLEEWTSTLIQLQPDLQTETQTPTDAQTETQTVPATRNYTGQSFCDSHINFFLI